MKKIDLIFRGLYGFKPLTIHIRIILIILCLITINKQLNAQSTEPLFCYTASPEEPQYIPLELEDREIGCYPNVSGPFYIRIYIHVIRRADGSGGYENSEIREVVSTLRNDFEDHKIYFIWDDCSVDNILDNNIYYNGVFTNPAINPVDPFFNAVTSINSHPDGIDIYLLPPQHPAMGGKSAGIPGKSLVIGGTFTNPSFPFVPSRVVSHEMGTAWACITPMKHNMEQTAAESRTVAKKGIWYAIADLIPIQLSTPILIYANSLLLPGLPTLVDNLMIRMKN